MAALTFFAATPTVFAQVANDNIEQRLKLKPEQSWPSSTVNCTVQRTCVDEKLTGKCVEYHNDQWFEFTPPAPGQYFVNINGQQCRDTRGVQLVVLTGKPCEVESYQIISCTSLGTQDDVFVTLENLQAGKPYLLNIDGYLHDQCWFVLQVSREPRGLPAFTTLPIPSGLPSSKVCTLNWHLLDTVKAQRFSIMRREAKAFKTTEVATVPAIRDSYGALFPDYTFIDTLPMPGNYFYQVVADGAEAPVMVLQEWRSWRKLTAQSPVWLNLPLDKYPNGADIAVLVTDPASGRVLRKARFIRKKKESNQNKLLISDWQQQGIRQILVRISWLKGGNQTESSEKLVTLPEAE
ncbi:hypothetical protein [Adhaeribacter soli]|uniref:Uncharacterized protein n=1 Tax=Adhaeribacter soli TaxID=2607655 RepID=A0A5N1IPY4_9BACT|nr:hypothetical protein [Adhaeribacter soli]KAA9331828.1 hypothetical protein F0P94_13595 [Adhaeribacter soli]